MCVYDKGGSKINNNSVCLTTLSVKIGWEGERPKKFIKKFMNFCFFEKNTSTNTKKTHNKGRPIFFFLLLFEKKNNIHTVGGGSPVTVPIVSLGKNHTQPCGCGYRNTIVAVAVAAAVAVEPQTATNFQFF